MKQLYLALLVFTTTPLVDAARPKIAVSANLGGYNLIGPLGFDLRAIPKPGTVIIQVIPASDGSVKNVTVVSGDPELRVPVLQAARKWRFSTAKPLPADLQAWIYFVEDTGQDVSKVKPLLPPPPVGALLGSIDISGASHSEEQELRKSINAKPGDVLTAEVWSRAKKAARDRTPPMNFLVKLGPNSLPYIRIWR